MSDGGYGDGYDAGFFEGGKTWKAKALDLEVKRDIAVSTLEKVKADRATAQKALAAQCEETKKLRAELVQARVEIERLENQVQARDAELWGRTQKILQLEQQLATEQAKNVGLRAMKGQP